MNLPTGRGGMQAAGGSQPRGGGGVQAAGGSQPRGGGGVQAAGGSQPRGGGGVQAAGGSQSTKAMPKCWGCNGDYASTDALKMHIRGNLKTRHYPCPKIVKLYNPETLVSAEWELLDDVSTKPLSVKDWTEMFGTGDYSVYVYLTKRDKIFTRVGQTYQDVKKRVSTSTQKPADDEEVYVLATDLSRSGASSLEAYLLQCHDLRDGKSTIRNYRYEQPIDAPEDKSSAEMRALAVRLLKGLMLQIKRGEVRPVELSVNRIKQRSRATHSAPVPSIRPSASTEKVVETFPHKSDSQLVVLRQAIEKEEQERRRTSAAESRKRRRRRCG